MPNLAPNRGSADALVRDVITQTVFHMLVVLDNCDTIVDQEETGYFELFYSLGNRRIRLTPIGGDGRLPSRIREPTMQ